MADGVSDDGSGGERLILESPAGRTDATSIEVAMEEEVEASSKSKILAENHLHTSRQDLHRQHCEANVCDPQRHRHRCINYFRLRRYDHQVDKGLPERQEIFGRFQTCTEYRH